MRVDCVHREKEKLEHVIAYRKSQPLIIPRALMNNIFNIDFYSPIISVHTKIVNINFSPDLLYQCHGNGTRHIPKTRKL